MIIDKDTNTSPTMDQAMGYVDRKADTFESWRIKGLGLQLVLMGLAEVQALRMSKLAGMVISLEDKLMNKEMLRNLEPKQLFSLYRMSTEALESSSNFVERTIKNMNWKEVEGQLVEAQAAEASEGDGSLVRETAGDLLSILSQAHAQASGNGDE